MKRKIEYRITNCDAGMRHEGDLPYVVYRSNADGSTEVVAAFHSPYLAQVYRARLSEELARMSA